MTGTDLTPDCLTPDKARVEALRDEVGPGPVIMLNLLKFKQPDGCARFAEYRALSGPLIARQGGALFHLGEVGPMLARESWDTCAMIRFPDIETFIGLAADPEYLAQALALREAALERTLWTVTQAPRPEAPATTRPSPQSAAAIQQAGGSGNGSGPFMIGKSAGSARSTKVAPAACKAARIAGSSAAVFAWTSCINMTPPPLARNWSTEYPGRSSRNSSGIQGITLSGQTPPFEP